MHIRSRINNRLQDISAPRPLLNVDKTRVREAQDARPAMSCCMECMPFQHVVQNQQQLQCFHTCLYTALSLWILLFFSDHLPHVQLDSTVVFWLSFQPPMQIISDNHIRRLTEPLLSCMLMMLVFLIVLITPLTVARALV